MKDLSNENIVHIKNGDVEYIQFRRLLEYKDKIQHCFTLIGKSCDYNNLPENKETYKKLCKDLNLNYDNLVRIESQVHSDIIGTVENKDKIYANMDGLITNIKGISLSLRFADCTPIYLYDPMKNVIGNVHSGWRGTVQKIGQKAVLEMINKYNCKAKDIICCIGPCIQKCHFKVDEDVKEIFEDTFSYLKNISQIIEKGEIEDTKQKYYIDTTLINIEILKDVGVKEENVIDSKICTACNFENIHSYRISKENSGRNTAIIELR